MRRGACATLLCAALLGLGKVSAAESSEPAAAPAVQREQLPEADPCYEAPSREERWLDWAHRQLGTRACATARWFDGFFGDQRFDDEVRKTHGRLSVGLSWSEQEGFELTPRFRLRAHLPNLSKRVNIFAGREDEGRVVEGRQSSASATTSQTQAAEDAIGVGYALLQQMRQRIDLKAGVGGKLSGGLNPFVQAQYRGDLLVTEQRLARLTETGFWRRRDGFGLTSALDFDHAFSEAYLLRWGNVATVTEAADGVTWQSTLTLFRHLGSGRAVAYELSAQGVAASDVTDHDYGARVIYRRSVLRDWLLGEIFVGVRWRRDEPSQPRQPGAQLGIGLEALFGARP